MKSSLLVTLSSGALVLADAPSTGYFPGQPSCALPCLSSAISEVKCALSDIGCLCGTKYTAIETMAANCVITGCAPTALAQAQSAGAAVCSSFSAGKLSFTTPAPSTQPGGPLQNVSTSSGSMSITSAPGSETSSYETTKTETLGGTSSLSGSLSIETTPSSTQTGAAATPAMLGAGMLAGMLAAVAIM
ncbi:hypothetical protein F5Y18DRAFT_115704 [Xylariaceae sp. FL1019]|nr:hypothetical protein F5Y18DRAFT_115704 [Xylariaceae sp. FL1019]